MASYWTEPTPARTQRAPGLSDEEMLRRRAGDEAAEYFLAAQKSKTTEAEDYEAQIGGLRGMQAGLTERFAQARGPQEEAVAALGGRAARIDESRAAAQMAAQREAAQARAMVAARTPYGGKGAGPETAILGGQIGMQQAAGMDALEQEAARRQGAYMQSLAALGAGTVTEAEQRRATEAEILRDMQARFLAAQQIAAGKEQRVKAAEAERMGALYGAGGAALAFMTGNPAMAAQAYQAGSKLGGTR
jgi:hypothetical protein